MGMEPCGAITAQHSPIPQVLTLGRERAERLIPQRPIRRPASNVFVFEDADVAPLAEIDLERDFRRALVGCALNHGRQPARIFPDRWRVHFLAEQFGAELFDQFVCFHASVSKRPG